MSDADAVHDERPIETPQAAIEESIAALSNCPDVLPTQAVRQARSHWEDFFPRLMKEMRLGITMAREGEDPGEIVFWGIALIAERRPGEVDEALPVLVEILGLPYDQIDLLISDLLTHFVPQALANAAGEDVSLLEGMFADPAIDVYARWAIGNALLRLVAEGMVPREQVVNVLHRQLQRVLEEHRSGTYSDDGEYPTALVTLLYDLLPHEAVADMEAAFAANLAEVILIDATAVREQAEQGEAACERAMTRIRESRFDDSLTLLESWYEHNLSPDWSTEEDNDLDVEDEDFEGDFEMEDLNRVPFVQTIRREQAKVGRNDPCPCGSGRKYKKCCGQS